MSTILITGASRGIGHELALRALGRGDTVFAAVRNVEIGTRFANAANVHVVQMDVADTASVERGFTEVDRRLAGKPLDAVVNCAAINEAGAIEVAPIEQFQRVINTNAFGSLRVLKAALPRLRGHGGRLVLVTSLWGRTSGALLGPYCSSKHMIESLADTARRETAGMGVHVILVEPGVVKTDMYTLHAADVRNTIAALSPEHDRLYGALHRNYLKLVAGGDGAAITAAQCATVIEKSLRARRPRPRYRAGIDSRVVCFLAWLLPDRWMDGVMGLLVSNRAA